MCVAALELSQTDIACVLPSQRRNLLFRYIFPFINLIHCTYEKINERQGFPPSIFASYYVMIPFIIFLLTHILLYIFLFFYWLNIPFLLFGHPRLWLLPVSQFTQHLEVEEQPFSDSIHHSKTS